MNTKIKLIFSFFITIIVTLIVVIVIQQKTISMQKNTIDFKTRQIEYSDSTLLKFSKYYERVEKMLFWCEYTNVPNDIYEEYLESIKELNE